MVVRVESADHSWVWLYMVLQLEAGDSPISSNNYIIRYYLYPMTDYHNTFSIDIKEIAKSTRESY